MLKILFFSVLPTICYALLARIPVAEFPVRPVFPPLGSGQPVCNVLSLSGGGAFGAAQMGVLDGLLTAQQVPDSFDIITGISAGGLNAGFLSYSDSVSKALSDISNIYTNLTSADIYQSNIFHILSTYAIYSTAPLQSTIANILSKKTPVVGSPITIIGATNVNKQTLDIYRFDTATEGQKVDILMATSAIPIVFPPHSLNDELYVDGGVISNEMIAQAVSQKACDFYNFTFINASPRTAANITISGFFSYVSAIGKLLLNTFDYQLAEYESLQCVEKPRGAINACFPLNPLLDNYSILDFDNGAVLYDLGKSSIRCFSYNFC